MADIFSETKHFLCLKGKDPLSDEVQVGTKGIDLWTGYLKRYPNNPRLANGMWELMKWRHTRELNCWLLITSVFLF